MLAYVVRLVVLVFFFATPSGVFAQSSQAADPAFRQKEHAKLYHYKTGKKIRELAATGSGDITIEAGIYPGLWGVSGPRPWYPHPFLVDQAFWADAVLVGVVKTCSSALTEDEDFLFSDCETTVEQVLKDNAVAPLKVAGEIVVTRAGGTLVVNGRTVRARDVAFNPFHPGGRYILFLKYIPATGAYWARNDRGFELLEKGVDALAFAGWVDMKTRQDPAAFVAEVQAAVFEARNLLPGSFAEQPFPG